MLSGTASPYWLRRRRERQGFHVRDAVLVRPVDVAVLGHVHGSTGAHVIIGGSIPPGVLLARLEGELETAMLALKVGKLDMAADAIERAITVAHQTRGSL